jgi:hypothetical protein
MPAALILGDLKASICAIMEHFLPARDFRVQFGIPKQKREAFALLARVNLAGYRHVETVGIVTPAEENSPAFRRAAFMNGLSFFCRPLRAPAPNNLHRRSNSLGAGAPCEQTVTLNSKMKTNSGRLTLCGQKPKGG